MFDVTCPRGVNRNRLVCLPSVSVSARGSCLALRTRRRHCGIDVYREAPEPKLAAYAGEGTESLRESRTRLTRDRVAIRSE